MIRVRHVITGLGAGGAERALATLARARIPGVESEVVSLGDRGVFAEPLERAGVRVVTLDVRGPSSVLGGFARLVAENVSRPADVVHGWLVHGALAATLAKVAVGRSGARLAWNVRQSLDGLGSERPSTRALVTWCAAWSDRADAIVYNSERAARQHEAIGHPPAVTEVIPNGTDTKRFRPDADARRALLETLGWPEDTRIVGWVGRWHPVKAPDDLLAAFARVARSEPRARFVLVGEGADPRRPEVAEALEAGGLGGRSVALGRRDDVERLMPAFDLLASASRAESMPNAIAEAMACGVACVATDVGATAELLGRSGALVPPGDPEALAAAIDRTLHRPFARAAAESERARRRIVERFGLDVALGRYQRLYESLVERAAGVSIGGLR